MGSKPPKAPDYQGAAQQQAQGSVDAINAQTQANRPNQYNAYGSSVTWGPNGEQSQHFSGPLGNISGSLQAQADAAMANPFSFGGPALMTGDAARNQAIDSAYGQMTSRLDPMWDKRESAMNQRLANMGIDPGSQAAQNAYGSFGRDRNDAYSSALAGAISQGTAAGDSAFRNNLLARQQGIGEAVQQRQMPLQELGQLGQFLQQPQFMGAGAAEGQQFLPALMAQGNYDTQRSQAINKMWADYMGGVGELAQGGAKLAALSDARAKQCVSPAGFDALPGVPVVTFEYRNGLGPPGLRIGVLAQHLAAVAPDLVTRRTDGHFEVDYGGLARRTGHGH